MEFGKQNMKHDEVKGKRVLEIGSYDVNGSLRSVIECFNPFEYIGVDITKGYGVDVVCSADDVRKRFGDDRFDVVVSTEMMEHVQDWRKVISNIKNITAPNGVILITTRSAGFGYHGFPYDFWRFETSDMKDIFSDFLIERLESDPQEPGVLIKAKKPVTFKEKDLSQIELFSIITGTRTKDIAPDTLKVFLQHNASKYNQPQKQSLKKRVKRSIRDIYWRLKKSL
jgi:SAM-dependent methyltransferase